MQILDKSIEDKIYPLFRLAFRCFFFVGSFYALLIVPLWAWMFQTGALSQVSSMGFGLQVPGLWWHAHEMIFGFAFAIIAGFVLTAVQTWTGIPGIKSKPLIALLGIWLLVRILFWLPVPLWMTACVEAFFLAWVAYEVGMRAVKSKNYRNLFFIPLFLLAIGFNFFSYATIKGVAPFTASSVWQAMLWWMMLLISIMGGRVIPFFTARKFNFDKPQPIFWLEWAANLPLLALIILSFFPLQVSLVKVILVFGGACQLVRLYRWKGYLSLSEPLVWSLHLGYLALPLGMLVKGLTTNPLLGHSLTHLFAIGTLAGVILAMICRVTMGHTGREIYKGPKMGLAYLCLSIAAIVRSFGVAFAPSQLFYLIDFAALCWVISLALYIRHFVPMLCQPRVDGHPG